MTAIKNAIKGGLGSLFKRYFSLLPGLKNSNIIFMYHRVVKNMPKEMHDPSLFVSADTFEMHIKEAAKLFDIIPLENMFRITKKNRRQCAITFDDGWIDNYEIAFPILKKYKVPATIFLPVSFINSKRCFWFENLYDIAKLSVAKNVEQLFIQYFHEATPSWNPPILNSQTLSDLTSVLKYLQANILDELIEKAYINLNITPSNKKMIMDWEQISEMGQYGITFGSHGLNHRILQTLDSEQKRREIFKSCKILEKKAIPMVPFYSYPNGRWDKESVAFVSEAGCQGAVTTHLGYNNFQTHPFLLNRVSMHEDMSHTPDLFWFRVFQAFGSGSHPIEKTLTY